MGIFEMAENLGLTKSQHLGLMRQQNIVKTRRDSLAILYSLANPKILVAYDALRKVLKEQLEADGKLLEKF
ncbi:MAG: hypothetical protein A3H67_03825 [Candidatus Buchananbacteria bacterium RIFCSPLOWO2_02_FULL_46_11b]|uniref:HTH arsR-type domain-containing protein n=2 Tax=Candidatus Buchananiibacteriota TaxID=1817903 RepID=A0A1G1YNW8_9BACT|nr:MAG: hypothetical protein A3B15_00160 [Candidatus Buchananbacteria bacterium RIFCSPLOWO2_01_FULL_45_31]OGY57320.1 MAG: hypothetical protein A3H67_03825 [Candidatus Buchananbacteria bacterium RIFCSPLOWO2_02_FULL_46_11b]